LKILINNQEEKKLCISSEKTVFQLKEHIYVISQILSPNDMQLSCADRTLIDSKKLSEYTMMQDGAVVVHSKTSLE
jgi:hypothetical protein